MDLMEATSDARRKYREYVQLKREADEMRRQLKAMEDKAQAAWGAYDRAKTAWREILEKEED